MADENQQEQVQPTIEDRLSGLEASSRELKDTHSGVTAISSFLMDKVTKLEALLERHGIRLPEEEKSVTEEVPEPAPAVV